MNIDKIYLLIIIACTLALGCNKVNDSLVQKRESNEIVEVLEDGSLRVKLNLQSKGMGNMSVSSRTTTDHYKLENTIYDGWCLVFGEDDTQDRDATTAVYTDNSPLIQKIPFVANANGDLYIVLKEYEKTAFIRIIANLTTTEEERLKNSNAWFDIMNENDPQKPSDEQVTDPNNNIATFNVYRHESVWLDGIYDMSNTNEPDPDAVSSKIPMSSVGFVMNEISEESIKDKFGSTIYMIRTCSKVDVTVEDAEFKLSEIYMIDCAQKSYIRSPILANTGTNEGEEGTELKDIPKDLGGTINYKPLEEVVASGGTSTAIYFYPNAGGNYLTEDDKVNKDINPQYIIIKGRAGGYDTDGYYKVALKAQYPLVKDADETKKDDPEQWSALTYDILRNTHFNVRLIGVDKPGYKTLADAKDANNPANNISYSINIKSEDSRNEILVSNGTYHIELNTTRVYMAGYGTDGNNGSISFTANPTNGNKYPAIYIEGDYGVNIKGVNTSYEFYNEETGNTEEITENINITNVTADDDGYSNNNVHNYWYKVPALEYKTTITVDFNASSPGHILLRIGDMLQFVPVEYDAAKISYNTNTLEIGGENNFSYEEIKFEDGYGDKTIFNNKGIVAENSSTSKDVEVRAQLYPVNADGITKIYFIQSHNDSDKRVEGVKQDGTDGNVIFLDNYTGKNQYDDVLESMKNMLKNGYTTIYFDEDYSKDRFLKGKDNSIFDDLNKAIANKEILGIDPDTFTYSIDMSKIDETSFSNQKDMTDFKDKYFKGNEYIKNLVLPNGIDKIKANAFNGCIKLESLTIGTPNNNTELEKFENDVFNNCNILKIVTVYNSVDEYPTLYKDKDKDTFTNSNLSSYTVTKTKSSGNAYEIVYTPK